MRVPELVPNSSDCEYVGSDRASNKAPIVQIPSALYSQENRVSDIDIIFLWNIK